MTDGAGAASEPINLQDERLWLLGGTVPAGDTISWLPAGATGWESLNCYLLLEGEHALMIDTGVTIHRAEILAQLDALVGSSTTLSVFLTRLELDTMSNLGPIADRFDLAAVYAARFTANPLEFFADVAIQSEISAASPFPLISLAAGEVIELGPRRQVTVLPPGLRLLATSWAFDEGTATLFTSDSFGHMRSQTPFSRRTTETTIETRNVARHLLTKFEWLEHVGEPAQVSNGLERSFAERRVTRIAPSHGSVIEGEDVVRRHKDLVVTAVLHPAIADETAE